MTMRQLMVWLNNWAAHHEDHELDMEVVMRVSEDDLRVGGLRSVSVDPGCTEIDALILDGDQEEQ